MDSLSSSPVPSGPNVLTCNGEKYRNKIGIFLSEDLTEQIQNLKNTTERISTTIMYFFILTQR